MMMIIIITTSIMIIVAVASIATILLTIVSDCFHRYFSWQSLLSVLVALFFKHEALNLKSLP